MRKSYAILLTLLAFAFCLRVVGQALVAAFGDVSLLPPMDAWYSGLLPYPILLPIQILILALQAKISLDIWRGSGYFSISRPRSGKTLCMFSYVYFAAMVLRYIVTM